MTILQSKSFWIGIAFTACVAAQAADFFDPVVPPRPFQVMVHRGMARQAPENTRPALARVMEDGLEWAEVDVRLTQDGHHVLLHNATVNGVTDGAGEVRSMTLDAVKRLDAGSWFAPHYANERILTLAEALTLCKGRLNLYLDCKEVNPTLLAKEILDADMARQVVVFDDVESLAAIRAQSNGKVPIMPKWHPKDGLDAWVNQVHPDAVEINSDEVTPEVCRFFHDKGVKVQAKVLGDDDHAEVWDRMLAAGVDWLQTDRGEDIVAHRSWGLQEKHSVLFSCHRGANRYAPENTLPAYEKAVLMGADYVEIDVRTSKDGQYFILHDGQLGRTTNGDGPLAALTGDELSKLDAGGWFGKAYQGTPMPRWDDVVKCLQGKAQLYIDAKDIKVEVLAEKIRSADLTERSVVYQSPEYLTRLRELLPGARGLCPLNRPEDIDELAAKVKPYAFDTAWNILSKDLIDKCHNLGIKVFSDGLDEFENVENYRKAMAWGIDVIQTDRPLWVIRAAELGPKP